MVAEHLLVGIVPSRADLQILETERWYRVPVDAAITLDNSWPPRWFAAFETVASGAKSQRVVSFSEVLSVERKSRRELLPGEPIGPKSDRQYYQLRLGRLQALDMPLVPKRNRRLSFIQTTRQKFERAQEFNDLFNDSPYEDELWDALKANGFEAERQWRTRAAGEDFVLDFAIFCNGKKNVDVEVDGRFHHSVEARSLSDAERDSALTSANWAIVRVTTKRVRQSLNSCLMRISDVVKVNGGAQRARVIRQDGRQLAGQGALFEEREPYDAEWEGE